MTMSWLSRLNPRGPGVRTGRNTAPSGHCIADPETCLMVFQNHWRQASWILEQREPSSSSDDLTAVRNHTDQMLCLLAEERPGESPDLGDSVSPIGPILELVVTENVLERVVQWHIRRGLDLDSQGALLKLFEMLIGQSHQPLLQHTAVLHPLLRLLGACGDTELGCPPALENSLVLLLNQVCVTMARQPVVLELLFRAAPAQHGSTNLLIFSLLVPFIHRDGALGQQARDALLLVMAASASHEAVARYIAENSYFCPVLATGLSALYSSLPRKIDVRGDDWHALRREDWMGVSSLVLFMNSLEFCNAVVQVSHPLVRTQLLDYLHNGFLVPVMGPALHKSSVDEMIASTAYLDLFLRSVSETSLLRTFLRFILLHRHDNDTILDTLLTRISSNSRLCMVSLSLFRTLLSLHCEDVMLQLILRYLLPCTHVMLSQRRAIRETDLYGKSANKFLSLIPECCRQSTAPSMDREDDNAFWGKVLSSPSSESPAPHRPSTPSRLSFFMRQQSTGTTPSSSSTQSTPPTTDHTLSPETTPTTQQNLTECLEWDCGYLEYLKDARKSVEFCSWACRNWSAPYDGENPSPNSALLPPPPPTSNPSMAMFPEHFSIQGNSSSSYNTPPNQRAAIVAAARSEWSSSERDSGEWDVTIGKNNCISLTPRSKKRSLQREELLPKPVPPLVPISATSTTNLTTSHTSPASHNQSTTITVTYKPLLNGTATQNDSQDRDLEVKKVKRDLDERQYLDENANQNGSVTKCMSQSCSIFSNDSSEGTSSSSIVTQDLEDGNQSVESLIEELLEQSPEDSKCPIESNGQGISIEAFTQELRELEDRVKERVKEVCQQEEPNKEERQTQQQHPLEDETGMTGGVGAEERGDSSVVGLCSPARPLNQPTAQPYTGPFMVVIFSKLENMLQNSLYVNILLTGIVAQLAAYPQPLLRSFLLNTNMVFQPSVKSLIQVLGSVKNRIEAFAASHEDFPVMLRKAQQYLVFRGRVDWSDLSSVPPLRRSDSLVKSRKPSLGDLILRHTNSPTRARHAAQIALAHVRDGGQSLHSALFRSTGGGAAGGLEKQAEALRMKNAVYSAVIFCEFLKELAALAQEHAVTLPFANNPSPEE
ncbi:FHF complex subunit HOOK interacting protein 1B [Periophthalmus magnuspinnatus]|uniref:FHF complex subunit HOOK interacting protein 1B n=1 Tax=Periophthalmus magnuspinnatus TaxID=409849 RepID=UPI00145B7D51|nr:FHF complex subunit HOOK interacting protein 1B [Periophthalmus magnuspinnatus]